MFGTLDATFLIFNEFMILTFVYKNVFYFLFFVFLKKFRIIKINIDGCISIILGAISHMSMIQIFTYIVWLELC